jgi:hypothetical protein
LIVGQNPFSLVLDSGNNVKLTGYASEQQLKVSDSLSVDSGNNTRLTGYASEQ